MRKQFTIIVKANEFVPIDQAKDIQRIVRDVMEPVTDQMGSKLHVLLELEGASEPKSEGGES